MLLVAEHSQRFRTEGKKIVLVAHQRCDNARRLGRTRVDAEEVSAAAGHASPSLGGLHQYQSNMALHLGARERRQRHFRCQHLFTRRRYARLKSGTPSRVMNVTAPLRRATADVSHGGAIY